MNEENSPRGLLIKINMIFSIYKILLESEEDPYKLGDEYDRVGQSQYVSK